MTTLGRRARAPAMLLICGGLVGCGLTVPDIKEAWDADKPKDAHGDRIPGAGQIEFEIKKHIYCELKRAVQDVNKNRVTLGSSPEKVLPIPPDFVAQTSLSLEVDESSALNPGVALNTVLPNSVSTFGRGSSVTTAQSRSVGFGGTLSSTATRIDKFDPQWTINYLMIKDGPKSVCTAGNDPFTKYLAWTPDSSSPLIIEGDLGIKDWLIGATLTNVFIPSVPGPKSVSSKASKASGGGASSGGGAPKPDTVSYEVKFIIISSGNVTPTWKLVNISANTTGTLFAAGRTRTHDLIITVGPNDDRTLYAHLASQIGQAVSGGNGALMSPQQ